MARIIEFAATNRLYTMDARRQFPERGGLMSYGIDYADHVRAGIRYVDISKHAGRVNDESILVDEIAA